MKRLIPFLVIFAFVSNASASPLNTSAEIVTSITIPDLSQIDFDSIIGSVVGGTLTFDVGGAISLAPNIKLLGDDQGGVARLVSVQFPSARDPNRLRNHSGFRRGYRYDRKSLAYPGA